MESITVNGIDLAKDVFQVHGTDRKGRKLINKSMSRKKLAEYMTKLPPCLVGMEACGTAHYWARRLEAMGHEVKLMAKQVRPALSKPI